MENSSQLPNPLLNLHHALDAETQPYGQIEIVTTFGQPQLEYAALHKSCGIMDLPFRGVLELAGRDRLTFLNGLISNQTWDKNTKLPMPAGTWVYAFLLNLKGRIVADMNVVDLGDITLIETDARLVEPLRDVFDKYQFAEQVKMRSRVGDLHEFSLLGPKSVEVLQKIFGESGALPPGQTAARLSVDGVETIAWRDNSTGTDGVNIIVPVEHATTIWKRLAGANDDDRSRLARPIGWAAFNACRIEAGRALFGIDFAGVAPTSAYPDRKLREAASGEDTAPGVLPGETGGLFNRAICLSKCYIGQEIVARMYARKQSARQIAGFKMQDDSLPIAGAPVFDAASNQVGVVTSSTLSPVRSNAAIGFAFVKKPHFAAETELTIPAEGAMRRANIVQLPLPDLK